MGRRGYPPEFRRRVLDLIDAGRKVVPVKDRDALARARDVSRKRVPGSKIKRLRLLPWGVG